MAETTSTNAELLAAGAAGGPAGAVLVADHQTAGRGRHGRTWVAPPGSSLLVSVLTRPTLPPDRLHLVTMAMAMSASEACEAVAGVHARLKWPNDLMVGDGAGTRKLGGVLAEAQPPVLVVGLGLNVNWPESLGDDLDEIATALNHVAGAEIDRVDLLVHLLRRFEHWYASIEAGGERSGEVAAELLAACRARSGTIGTEVEVHLGAPDDPRGEVLQGTAVDIDDDGHLQVSVPGEASPRTVVVGDVVQLR